MYFIQRQQRHKRQQRQIFNFDILFLLGPGGAGLINLWIREADKNRK